MDTLDLVLANDGVLQGGAVGEEEDGVLVTTLLLAGALDATAIGLHATIEDTGDGLGLLVGDAALGGGDGESSTLLEEVGGALVSGDGDNGGNEGQDGGSDGELHFDELKRLVDWKVEK